MHIRILWLNAWGGRVPGFLDWFREQVDTYDIIGLQEVPDGNETVPLEIKEWQSENLYAERPRLLKELEHIAYDFESVFASRSNKLSRRNNDHLENVPFGQVLFVRKRLAVDAYYKRCFIYSKQNIMNTEVCQSGVWSGAPGANTMVACNVLLPGSRSLTVANLHGLWSRRGKVDMKERDEQSGNILKHLEQMQGVCGRLRGVLPELVCGGDFNYHDDMRALHTLEQSELFGGVAHQVNLNRAYSITDTRTKYYSPDKTLRQADYVLVQPTPSMYVESYTVDRDVPSDHAALRLELSF